MGAILTWLTARVGGFLAPILYYILEKTVGKIYAWASAKIATYLARRKRAKEQEGHQKKVEEDIQKGAERNEQTEKNEQDWLNS